MNRHLVTVEVGVECSTNQRMQLDRLAFDQHRLERLDAETVQGRGTVQHDRVLLDHLLKDVPDFRALAFDEFFSALDRRAVATLFQLVVDKRLEQLKSHLLRQTTLVQLQFGSDNDNRTTGVIDTLTEQVLTETAALAFKHIGKRLEWTLVRAGDRTTATAVVEQGVNSFLQHALFIADDHLGRAQFHQALEAVVPVNHATVKIVEVRGGKTTAIEGHQRTQFRRQDRDGFKNHPYRAIAAGDESVCNLEALGDLLALGLAGG